MRNKFKKQIVVLCLLLATAGITRAQEILTEFWHENGLYSEMHNIVEAEDNTLLLDCHLFEYLANDVDIGSVIYKVSMEGEFLDSLLIYPSDNISQRTFFEAVPGQSDSYLYALFERDVSDSTSFLKMFFIDKDLNVTDSIDVALEEAPNDYVRLGDLFVDPNNDLIVSYTFHQKVSMLRIGLDGSIKDRKRFPEIYEDLWGTVDRHTGVYCESPLLYYFLGIYTDNGREKAYFIDADLKVVEEKWYIDMRDQLYFISGIQEHFTSYNDSCYLFASHMNGWVNYQHHCYSGLIKYDRNHNLLAKQLFGEDAYSSIGPIPMTIVSAPDTIYYSYMTNFGVRNQLVLVCLDGDLNVRWTRYMLEPDMFHWAKCMVPLRNGKVAIGSYQYGESPNSISVVVIEDKLWDVPEAETCFRPYAFYPNPVRDRLSFHYSPDVKPQHVALCDLQGRELCVWRSGFESLDLSGLSAGTYMLRVTLKGGKSYSDPVVKE
ncbi:MAG: T9SS type A sorting domain-containing protein [Candidatus Limimorpha sp.]